MDNPEIHFWKVFLIVGGIIVSIIAGLITWRILWLESQQKKDESPILALRNLKFIDFKIEEKIKIQYEILNLLNDPVKLENTSIGIVTADDFFATDIQEQNSKRNELVKSNANIIISKDSPYRAIFVTREAFPLDIIEQLNLRLYKIYFIGECDYITINNTKKWKYRFIIKVVEKNGVVGIDYIQNENVPDKSFSK